MRMINDPSSKQVLLFLRIPAAFWYLLLPHQTCKYEANDATISSGKKIMHKIGILKMKRGAEKVMAEE